MRRVLCGAIIARWARFLAQLLNHKITQLLNSPNFLKEFHAEK
jgi:hypothetical protein